MRKAHCLWTFSSRCIRPSRCTISGSTTWKGASQQLCAHSSLPAKKPYYVTSPIFYVNAGPHIASYNIIGTDIRSTTHRTSLYISHCRRLEKMAAVARGTSDPRYGYRRTWDEGWASIFIGHYGMTLNLGLQIQEAASAAGRDPRSFCDEAHQSFHVRIYIE